MDSDVVGLLVSYISETCTVMERFTSRYLKFWTKFFCRVRWGVYGWVRVSLETLLPLVCERGEER